MHPVKRLPPGYYIKPCFTCRKDFATEKYSAQQAATKSYMNAISMFPFLSVKEEKQLSHRIHKEDKQEYKAAPNTPIQASKTEGGEIDAVGGLVHKITALDADAGQAEKEVFQRFRFGDSAGTADRVGIDQKNGVSIEVARA